RMLGSLPSWLTTNVDRGAGGANGGYNAGTSLTVAATDGTTRAFTKALLDSVHQACYTAGGNPSVLMLHPTQK
ncbi:SU10 major capsid protein, partial [Vibrio parahaemolyticus]